MFNDPNTGNSDIDTAKKCFRDNFNRFGNATTNPEKYNLYKGLERLAAAVETIQNDIQEIKAHLARR